MLMSLNDFHVWEKSAVGDERVTYFEGDLAFDRGTTNKSIAQIEIGMTADRAYEAQAEGRVHLIQERISAHRWKYVAVKAFPSHQAALETRARKLAA